MTNNEYAIFLDNIIILNSKFLLMLNFFCVLKLLYFVPTFFKFALIEERYMYQKEI